MKKASNFTDKKTALGILAWLLWIALCLVGCAAMKPIQDSREIIFVPVPSTVTIEGDIEEQHKILLAFEKAYPGIFGNVEFLNNDWTMVINGTRFFYAHGRFLPGEISEKWEDYLPYDFYDYPWIGTDRQRKMAYENPLYSVGSSFLFDALYDSATENAGWDWQEKYSFLDVKMLIHPYIKPMLDRVSDQILAAAITDPSINEWIAELQTSPPGGWNWRTIAGTNRRSNHSYGTAIDLLPRELKGRRTYWRWEIDNTTIDHENYYLPPEAVIRAFEDNGFIWGGKWDLIDTMHFEYRPEILLLNGFFIQHLW